MFKRLMPFMIAACLIVGIFSTALLVTTAVPFPSEVSAAQSKSPTKYTIERVDDAGLGMASLICLKVEGKSYLFIRTPAGGITQVFDNSYQAIRPVGCD